MIPGFQTEPNADALPLWAIDDVNGWLDAQSSALRAWHTSLGAPLNQGQPLLLPAEQGLCGAAVRVDPEQAVHALAGLPMTLPAGLYRLDARHSRAALSDLLLGWGLGAYQFSRYRKPRRLPAQLLWPADLPEQPLSALLDAIRLTRDLVNTPTEDMGPEQLERVMFELALRHGADFRSISGEQLLAENLPAIHAVGRASHRSPRLLDLRWGPRDAPRLSLVGKGVCFDTGGLNIKPADGMRNMKKDMGGAAHAIALAGLIMDCGLPVRLRLLVPAVENAISGNAYRPGEVISTRAGISVEIDNTDAEGRIVLCDALQLACEEQPDLLLDFATLTGAARIALGPELPAMFTRDTALAAKLLEHGGAVEDPVWPLPLHAPYLRFLESSIADLANSGATRHAGAITAALFLAAFVPQGQAWVHFDTYAWNDADRPGHPKGGEAQGLRACWAMLEQRYRP